MLKKISIIWLLLFYLILIILAKKDIFKVYFDIIYILAVSLPIFIYFKNIKFSSNDFNIWIKNYKILSIIIILFFILFNLFLEELVIFIVKKLNFEIPVLKELNVIDIFSLLIIAPLFEEILTKKILIDYYFLQYNNIKIVLYSTLFFAILHDFNFNPIILSLISSYIYVKIKNFSISVFIHFVFNLIFVMDREYKSIIFDFTNNNYFNLLIIFILLLIITTIMFKKINNKPYNI